MMAEEELNKLEVELKEMDGYQKVNANRTDLGATKIESVVLSDDGIENLRKFLTKIMIRH